MSELHFQLVEERAGETERVWSMDGEGEEAAQHGYSSSAAEELPAGLARSDTINSTTVFVNPSEIQPRQTHRYSGASLEQGSTGQRNQGIKRPHSEQDPQEEQEADLDEIPFSPVSARLQCEEVTAGPDGNIVSHIFIQGADDFVLGAAAEDGAAGAVAGGQQGWDTGPSPTSVSPGMTDYPGDFQFDATFSQLQSGQKNKNWDYSANISKLFIDMNKWVQVMFRVGATPPDGLWVRALPVYSDPAHLRDPVRRCPIHASPSDPTNSDILYTEHLIRFDQDSTEYHEDPSSGRLSTVFPVTRPHQGTDNVNRLMKFMCLGSDVGGINRRPVSVVFTLETGPGNVVGRRVVAVRICSCPKRDKAQEEAREAARQGNIKRVAINVAERFATTSLVLPSTASQLMPPPGKRLLEKDPVIMVPVHVDDFKKLNEFAESAWVQREVTKTPGQAEKLMNNIKDTRRRLLNQHNRDLLKRIEKNEPKSKR